MSLAGTPLSSRAPSRPGSFDDSASGLRRPSSASVDLLPSSGSGIRPIRRRGAPCGRELAAKAPGNGGGGGGIAKGRGQVSGDAGGGGGGCGGVTRFGCG